MPPATTVQDFIDALRSRKSKVARAMDALFGTKAARQALQGRMSNAQLQELMDGFPNMMAWGWAQKELHDAVPGLDLGLGDFQHMDQWPHKMLVQQALKDAFLGAGNIEFFWELYDGTGENTEVQTDAQGNLTVTFRSPRNKVTVNAAGDDIKVLI